MVAEIDKLRWAILDSLADDYESMEMIVPAVRTLVPDSDERTVSEQVGQLLLSGFVETVGKSEVSYGMTGQGCEVWEKYCTIFSEGPPDWSKSWTMDVDYTTGVGYVNGTSREVCESAIAKHAQPDIVIDTSSFKHTSIEGFKAKYYKKLKGGHRIDFRFQKKAA